MKTRYPRMALGLMLGFLALARGAGAQEPDLELPPPLLEAPPPSGGPDPAPPPGGGHSVDRWMNRLEKRNPDEFRRYQDMRLRDPEGFRRELAGRLGRERLQKAVQAHPRLQAFLESLPEQERVEILISLGRALRPEGPPPPDEGPIETGQGEIARLAREFQTTTDPAQRERIRADLKARLGALFDAREQRRTEHIQRIQAELARLQGMLESRRGNRDEIIERRLQELTGDESLKW